MADSTAGVEGIAVVAVVDVAMEMKDGLAGGLAAVHAQVIAIGLVTSVNHLTGGANDMGIFRGTGNRREFWMPLGVCVDQGNHRNLPRWPQKPTSECNEP